jgi:hypothetical protein
VKPKPQSVSVSQIQDLTMLEASKVSTGGYSDKAIEEVLTADCSTLDELEDFIDRSFKKANVLMRNNTTTIENTCMQKPLALLTKSLYFPNIKYLK